MIENGMVVDIDYAMHLGDGTVVDRSEPGQPVSYLHGIGQIVPGLERAVAGMSVGESKSVVLSPADGYGEHDPASIREIPRGGFMADLVLEPGMRFVARGPRGEDQPFSIQEVREDTVLADFNHPLAGRTLHFEVTVRGARDATPEELEQARQPQPAPASVNPFSCSCGGVIG